MRADLLWPVLYFYLYLTHVYLADVYMARDPACILMLPEASGKAALWCQLKQPACICLTNDSALQAKVRLSGTSGPNIMLTIDTAILRYGMQPAPAVSLHTQSILPFNVLVMTLSLDLQNQACSEPHGGM